MHEKERQEASPLSKEASTYLRQHAHDAVRWHPWGEEALRRAKEEDKPIFLSIGYASCHWCHVMQRESFNDPEVAALLNRHFVPVLVDREERPDVDELFMTAAQLLSGQAGWPLNIFLTPSLKPIYGGTYFPPQPRYGLPSFKQVLLSVLNAWRTKRAELEGSGEEVMKRVLELYSFSPAEAKQEAELAKRALEELVVLFDDRHGGFGQAPKFPMPGHISFLLRYYALEGERVALTMATRSLIAMARGGIHDQLGGGFHRYSTDRAWLLPHFEKMLQDNALLARLYLEAYQLTGDERLAEAGRGALDWALREMRGPGGFYSALDADSEGIEGKYYVWTKDEVLEALGEELGELACSAFGITKAGNLGDGLNLPYVASDYDELSRRTGRSADELRQLLGEAKRRLLEARERRTKPSRDEKVVAAYNGLMISALAKGYEVLGVQDYRRAAETAARFVLEAMCPGGELYRSWANGVLRGKALLEDYAFLVRGLIDLYEATLWEPWLERAHELHEEMVRRFYDEAGGFYSAEASAEGLPRIKSPYEGSSPSGNSYALWNCLYFAELLGEERYRQIAKNTLKAFWAQLDARPSGFTFLLSALLMALYPAQQVAVAAEDIESASALLREIYACFLPNRVLAAALPGGKFSRVSPLLRDKLPVQGRPTVYVCANYSCSAPAQDREGVLRALLETARARRA